MPHNFHTEIETAFDPELYLFPDHHIPQMSTDALRDRIQYNLPKALDQVDGRYDVLPEQIDFAQDIIHQCRDELLKRGESFSEDERTAMDFLSWPLTPEQLACEAERAIRAEEALQQKHAKWATAQERTEVLIQQCLKGDTPEVDLSGCTLGVRLQNCRGRDALLMADRLEHLGVGRPSLSYVCSRAGVSFADDLSPSATLHVSLNGNPLLWSQLLVWYQAGLVQYFEFWGDEAFASVETFHYDVTRLFGVYPPPAPRESSSWLEFEPAPVEHFAAVPAFDVPALWQRIKTSFRKLGLAGRASVRT